MKLNRADWLKIIILIAVFGGGIAGSYFILKPQRSLPVYNPSDLDRRLVDEDIRDRGRHHRVLPFSLINQNGDTITQQNVEGKIYVADFFFTVCPDICKDMAAQKRRLQNTLKNEDDFLILSHSVTPDYDTVSVLKAYAEKQGAITGKWHLLTGDKPQIYKLARQSYFAVLDEGGSGDESDFIHTENFVLIDEQKRIRGFYDGTRAEEVDQLIEDFYLLKAESEN